MSTDLANNQEEQFLSHLIEQSRIPAIAADRVRRVQLETMDRLASVILKLGMMSEEVLAAELASFAQLQQVAKDQLLEVMLPEGSEVNASFLLAHELVPVESEGDSLNGESLNVVCWDPLESYAVRALEFATGRKVHLSVATRAQVLAALSAVLPVDSKANTEASRNEAFEDEEIERLKDLASEAPVIRFVQRVVDEAVRMKASDIHIEPSEHKVHVRFRLDGLLREIETQSRDMGASIVSRIKVMASLNIAERRLPQDGRIRTTVQGKEIDFRVATSPTLHGESVVLRILDRQDIALDFDALGFDERLKNTVRAAISRPFGIVLVTGPTGSGKTTTLYAALKEINTPDKKILTIEDPVEYVLNGVNQVPLKPQIGLTFASALRAFLRQDPDILMVGEIRDRETAEIAIQAALTGHLLFSTLHTNTASGAITRLLDMGMDDYLLTSTLHLILGQRLVRKLCAQCRQPYSPAPDVLARFGLPVLGGEQWFAAKGCPACQGSGFKGRTTIIEALPMTDAVRARVLEKADAHAIQQVAVGEGMRTMFEHGLERVRSGLTTIEEVLRVTSLA
jgi:general secretion pathway protein E